MHIVTEHPIALDSNDHLKPWGAIQDYGDPTNLCNYMITEWPDKKTLLDLGTANGSVVAGATFMGYDAYGIEGSDAARKGQGESEPWGIYYNTRLFNADLRYPFYLYKTMQGYFNRRCDIHYETYDLLCTFSLITAWDVMEHLTEDTIDVTMNNIARHSHRGTFFLATIQFDNVGNKLYHHLLKHREWWLAKFAEFGFKNKGFCGAHELMRWVPQPNRFWFEKE